MQDGQHATALDLAISQCITISKTNYHTSQMHTEFISEIYLKLLKQLLSSYFKLGLRESPDRSRWSQKIRNASTWKYGKWRG